MTLTSRLACAVLGLGTSVGLSGCVLPSKNTSNNVVSFNFYDKNNDGKIQMCESNRLSIAFYDGRACAEDLVIFAIMRKPDIIVYTKTMSPPYDISGECIYFFDVNLLKFTKDPGGYNFLLKKDNTLLGKKSFTTYED